MNTKDSPAIEGTSKHGLLSIYRLLILFGFLLFCTFLSVMIWQDMQRAEDDFKQYTNQVHQSLVQSFTVNETILDGFAAFLADVGVNNPNRARFYTHSMLERYKHLYMFQAAQRVRGDKIDLLEKNLSPLLGKPLNVRRFEFGKGLVKAQKNSTQNYYPIVFVEPSFSDGLNILGLDISSIEFIKGAMDNALSSGLAYISQPIELSEGNPAFVMIKPSMLPGQKQADQYALLVVKTSALLPRLRPKQAGYELTLAYPEHEPILELKSQAIESWQQTLFPKLKQDTLIQIGTQNLHLSLSRQLSFKQVNLYLVATVLLVTMAIGVFLHLYMRIHFEAEQLKQQANRILYQKANYDQLTGLANRHHFEDHFARAMASSKRRNNKMALLYMDLNDFKTINDTQGHQMGDHVLVSVAAIIMNMIRVDDVACRFGGDEFIILLENIHHAKNAKRVMNGIQNLLSEVSYLEGENVKISASIGYSIYPDEGDSLSSLLKCADKKMYDVKRSSKVVKLETGKNKS